MTTQELVDKLTGVTHQNLQNVEEKIMGLTTEQLNWRPNENTWSINDLPTRVFVITMSNEEVLCGKSIWLNINISVSDIINEGGLSDVGETCYDKSTLIGVNSRETGQMLSDFFEIGE